MYKGFSWVENFMICHANVEYQKFADMEQKNNVNYKSNKTIFTRKKRLTGNQKKFPQDSKNFVSIPKMFESKDKSNESSGIATCCETFSIAGAQL